MFRVCQIVHLLLKVNLKIDFFKMRILNIDIYFLWDFLYLNLTMGHCVSTKRSAN